MMDWHDSRVSRRTTLSWFGGVTAFSSSGMVLSSASKAATAPSPVGSHGYGNDPDLLNPQLPWPRTLTPSQLKQIAVLTDIILPKVGAYPAPSEVGIPDFVDEWVSAPYPDQQRDRSLLLGGLTWLDSEAKRLWQSDFVRLGMARQVQLVERISVAPQAGDAPAEQLYQFFRSVRTITVGSYYSLPQNFAEIGYVGNQALQAFPPPTAEEDAFIDRAIAKLNL